MDESIVQDSFNPMSIKKGTQFLVMMISVEEHEAFASESKEDTLNRFRKHMHALITDIAKNKGVPPEQEKSRLKAMLKQEGLIKESTNELSLDELASVIIRLKHEKHGTQ